MADQTVLERFRHQCVHTPDRVLYTQVDDAGRDQAQLTYAGLAHSAQAIAASLGQRHGLRPGDRVLLVYPQSLDFIEALVGCMLAGLIPAPVYPPNPLNPGHTLELMARLAEQCGARAILTNGEYSRFRQMGAVKDFFTRRHPDWPQLPWLRTDRMASQNAASADLTFAPTMQDIAFLQFTSGSTASPKGVMVTYGNLDHQLTCNGRELGFDADARSVFWVPQYHDFGLVSGVLSGLFGNGHFHILSPLAFVQRPGIWLDVVHRVRATHIAGPNFAYDLLVNKSTAKERQAWDLSSLQIVMSAAEPISPAAVDRFLAAFAPSGLRREAFCPAYGLAEHTVGVSVRGRARLHLSRDALAQGRVQLADESATEGATQLVGCGLPSQGVTLRIVEPGGARPSPSGVIGEIWVDSPSKAAGYWGLEEESRATFGARLDGGSERAYLRTGDLGFLYQGELFITGRLKDLIIVHGRNYYPQDIEESVRDAHALIRPGGVAAFSVPDSGTGRPTEQLVVLVEVRKEKLSVAEKEAVITAVQQSVARDHQLACSAIVLGRRGAVPKTTSGKVQRGVARQHFLDPQGPGRDRWIDSILFAPTPAPRPAEEPSAPNQRHQGIAVDLKTTVAAAMGWDPDQLQADLPLISLGLNSLAAMELKNRIQLDYGLDLPLAIFAEGGTLASLTRWIADQLGHQFPDGRVETLPGKGQPGNGENPAQKADAADASGPPNQRWIEIDL